MAARALLGCVAALLAAGACGLLVGGAEPLLVRAYLGQDVQRPPVWLMRQAGRYMSEFRQISEKFGFRHRSETPELAVELSLQPWRRFGVDGVIMFSDILTPLPALGVEFTMVEGHGPKFPEPLRTLEAIDRVGSFSDVDRQVPFLRPILQSLRSAVDPDTAVIGFIGAPWTLAAYSVEGSQSKLCKNFKLLCQERPDWAHKLLDKYTDALCLYASHQVACGAQVVQVFESWAHHMSEQQFASFAKPYAARIAKYLKGKHPGVPVVYFANGGSAFLQQQVDMGFDALSLDWRMSMRTARAMIGQSTVLAGNLDPSILYGSDEHITEAVRDCIRDGGDRHVVNLGHGIEKDMTEHAVEVLVNEVKKSRR